MTKDTIKNDIISLVKHIILSVAPDFTDIEIWQTWVVKSEKSGVKFDW